MQNISVHNNVFTYTGLTDSTPGAFTGFSQNSAATPATNVTADYNTYCVQSLSDPHWMWQTSYGQGWSPQTWTTYLANNFGNETHSVQSICNMSKPGCTQAGCTGDPTSSTSSSGSSSGVTTGSSSGTVSSSSGTAGGSSSGGSGSGSSSGSDGSSSSGTGSNTTERFYSTASFWNQPIPATVQIDPNSSAIVQYALAPYAGNSTLSNGDDWGIGLIYASSTDKTYTVVCTQYYCSQQPIVSFPIPKGAMPTTGSDHHLTVINGNQELDMWDASYDAANDTWSAGSRFIDDLYGWGANAAPGQRAGSMFAAPG